MFVLSKLADIALNPGNFLLGLLVLGVLLCVFGARRSGGTLVVAVTVLCVAIAVLPVGRWVVAPLENRFPQPQLPQRIDGIVLLGGAVSIARTIAHGQVALNDMAARITETLALAQRYPDARVLISGGDAAIVPRGLAEADFTRRLLVADGLDDKRILVDTRSRDTYENAVYSKEVANPQPGQVWVLVTSANHMPRAVGSFRSVGFDVIPYPVDYDTGPDEFDFDINLAGDLQTLGWATHEWLGLADYWVRGRIAALFPGPAPISATSAR
jgi:uncharacterized SAM-binding protein YcdF (DUF218 family)